MPRLVLYSADVANQIFVNVDPPAADGSVVLRSLQLPKSAAFAFTGPAVSLGSANIEPLTGGTGGDLQLKASAAELDLTISYSVASAGSPFNWFGVEFQGSTELTAELALAIPVAGEAPDSNTPIVTIRACGSFAISTASVQFVSRPFCCQVEIAGLDPATAGTPRFRVRPPHLGLQFPRLALPWTFPDFPKLPFHLGSFSGGLGKLPLAVSYESVDVNADGAAGTVTIDINHLKIASGSHSLDGDLHVALNTGGIDFASSWFHLYQPDFAHLVTLPFSSGKLAAGCLTLGWTESKLHDLLALLSPDLAKADLPSGGVQMRLLADGVAAKEIRIDFAIGAQTVPLPGFDLILPDAKCAAIAKLADPRLVLVAQLDAKKKITANSDFTWVHTEEETREVQTGGTSKQPFLSLSAETSLATGLVIMDLPLSGGLPTFMHQLNTPLGGLGADCTPSDTSSVLLQPTNWGTVGVDFNANDVKLPFLQALDQFVSVTVPTHYDIDLHKPVPRVPLDVTVKFGTLQLETTVTIDFSLETFAFRVHDDAGLMLTLKSPMTGSLFGLKWDIQSKEGKKQDFNVLAIVIKDSNYQIKQGPDAVFQLQFTQLTAGGSPLVFSVSNFALGPKGVDLDADVLRKPVKLAGIDTKFVFNQGSFQIRENKLTDFSISGSGPLPPALVGSATASIALQFHQDSGGDLKLVSSGAKLEGKNLLKCNGTRFQFSVEALGLKFVEQSGTYHLYFTITGSAKFVPAPGDDASGPLAWLPQIEMRLMECPLTGDARVISQHVQFLVEMPRKVTFSILGCFAMEIRAIGFVPQADMFDAFASAMRISGQIKFAEDGGDALDARIDFHDLFIGLPAPGSFVPRIYCKELGVKLKAGGAFDLNGIVDFLDNEEIQPGIIASGFRGSGTISIQGLPTMSGSFAFLRVRDVGGTEWKRAWFLYLEVDKVAFQIPVVEIFLREVGLGFGYRYTLAMIQEADQTQDPKKLLQTLKKLSVSQGELSQFDQWRVDVGGSDDPRWTVVLRALIAETAATEDPLEWLEDEERELPCLFLMDAVLALRSDLTFLMTVRGWLNTNYWDYVNDTNGVRTAPLLSGFVLLSPKQKRLLAHVGSNAGAQFGDHPPLPDFLKSAIRSSYFTATLLVEPGLIQYELGWPNMLGWTAQIGPLIGEFRGGAIFRASKTEIVVGMSYQARATLDIAAGFDLGFMGARLTARASVAYGSRYIGVLGLVDPINTSAFYAVEGIDIRVAVAVEFWIKIDLFLGSITIDFNFSFAIAITASVQVGLLLHSPYAGIRGAATVSLNVMGHGLNFGICIAANTDAVDTARGITDKFLSVGLESTDVQPIPGEPTLGDAPPQPAPAAPAVREALAARAAGPAAAGHAVAAATPVPIAARAQLKPGVQLSTASAVQVTAFITPDYTVFSIAPKKTTDLRYFLLLPSANRKGADRDRLGFLPPPPDGAVLADGTLVPAGGVVPTDDFTWTLPAAIPNLEHYVPGNSWQAETTASFSWKADWDSPAGKIWPASKDPSQAMPITLRQTLRYAYTVANSQRPLPFGTVTPIGDPIWPNHDQPMADDRVQHPSNNSYEAAVAGAACEVTSPRFKADPYSPFDQQMSQAYSFHTTVYQTDSQDQGTEASVGQAVQLRSSVIQQMIRDVSAYAAANENDAVPTPDSVAFRMGLLFRVREADAPDWLLHGGVGGTITQRQKTSSLVPDTGTGAVEVFNREGDRFDKRPPRFDNVKQFADDNTIAIAWDLKWDGMTQGVAREDPEHHLGSYTVRRLPLDGADRGVEYTVRPAEALHRATPDAEKPEDTVGLKLRPRFHVIDHFNHETLEDQAALPLSGRSYLYTITPIDVGGHPSPRPLTLMATRFPHVPPLVASDGEVTVNYTLPEALQPAMQAVVQQPTSVTLTLTPVTPTGGTPRVPAVNHRLVFRREQVLPIGSYGLDSAAQGSQSKGLPVSNAAPLRTDIKVDLPKPTATGGKLNFDAPLTSLITEGVLPSDGVWRADSWRIFVQAQSRSKVWSSLAPVQVKLQFVNGSGSYVTRPASLEWIAQPLQCGPLPPFDESANTGYAEVPMPPPDPPGYPAAILPADATVSPLTLVKYAVHPEKPRAVRFQWNQGPSDSVTPPDLHAGYNVYEFDVDAHRPNKLAEDLTTGNLRLVQEIELLPQKDVDTTPRDTLQTERWEAWYAATVERIGLAARTGVKTPLSGWYSWRESMVVWPPAAGMYPSPGKVPRMHPFLTALRDKLQLDATGAKQVVDLAPIRPSQVATLDDFMQETVDGADPYGWRILQRMGLSICFLLRNPKTSENATGGVALSQVHTQLNALLVGDALALKPHLHVELLFQAGKSLELAPGADPPAGQVDGTLRVGDDALLAAVQVSLRPLARQMYFYKVVELTMDQPVPADAAAALTFHLDAGHAITALELTAVTSSAASSTESGLWAVTADCEKQTIAMPQSGKATLLLRSESLGEAPVTADMPVKVASTKDFDFTDPRAAWFTADVDAWTEKLQEKGPADSPAQWTLLGNYLTMPGMSLPVNPQDQQALMPELLSWMARFLDTSPRGPVTGPWIATAYPRLVSPLPVVPDAAGRVSYVQLVTDPYAHAFRYYIWPQGRYDALWETIINSKLFAGKQHPSLAGTVDASKGGLDVVLDRVRELTPPLVLATRRIDAFTQLTDPAPPGPTWEVIVAKHPEQTLAERNWTIARQLSFRQIAYTMLRTFAYQEQLANLKRALSPDYAFEIEHVEQGPAHPLLPGPYSAPETERLDMTQPDDVRALDLPLRFGPFSQGALVLQWRALPYLYKQQLVLAAQAARVASTAVSVTQRDYEYLSPVPSARGDAQDSADARGRVVRSRVFDIRLASYWECLPESARARWPLENPQEHEPPTGTKALRKYASLPDIEAIYQLVLQRQPALSETITEFYFDTTAPGYKQRSYSRTLFPSDPELGVPDALTDRQAPMFITTTLATDEYTQKQHDQDLLSAIPDLAALNSFTAAVASAGAGREFLELWYPSRGVSQPVQPPASSPLAGLIEFRESDKIVLAWDQGNEAALDSWANSVDAGLKLSIEQLKTVPVVVIPRLFASENVPDSLKPSLRVTTGSVTWAGGTTDALITQFNALLGGLSDQSPAKIALTGLGAQLAPQNLLPAAPACFAQPAPDVNALATLIGLPPDKLKVDVAPTTGNWSLTWPGINLGHAASELLSQLPAKIANPADSSRVALTAIFEAVQAFSAAALIPGVPAELKDHVLFAPYLLRLKSLPANMSDLLDLYTGLPADQASLSRLLGDFVTLVKKNTLLAPWVTEQAVSSSTAFAANASSVNVAATMTRVEFATPDACLLKVKDALTPVETQALLTAAVTVDSSFADGLRQIAGGASAATASLGLEQLVEINPNVDLPTAANPDVVWHGPVRPAMRSAVDQWSKRGSVGATMTALAQKFAAFSITVAVDAGETQPRPDELSRSLEKRLTLTPESAQWQGLDLDSEEEADLRQLAASGIVGPSLKAALTAIAAGLTTGTVTVAVQEAGFIPRPRAGELVPEKLLIGNGVMRFHGVMSRAEAKTLSQGVSAPDAGAVAELFSDSWRAGMNGAEIVVRARLGSADTRKSEIGTTLN